MDRKTVLGRCALRLFPALSVALSGCGVGAGPSHRPLPTLTVRETTANPLALVPISIAQRLGLFRQQGIAVREVASKAAPVSLGSVGQRWPIVGVLAQGIDGFIVAPEPDPGFRLAALNQVPVAYPKNDPDLALAFRTLMHIHQVQDYLLEPLNLRTLINLWKSGHMPYVVANTALWHHLKGLNRSTTALAALSASMGPMPSIVIAGRASTLPQFLAALNLSLWYIETHAPKTLLPLLPHRLRTPTTTFFLQLADRYQWFPATTVPIRQNYQRGLTFWHMAGLRWPSYERAVDTRPSLTALSLTP